MNTHEQTAPPVCLMMPVVDSPSPVENKPDFPESFIPRLKSGDSEAFARFYQIYRRRVFGSILKIVEIPATAEDLAQESFLKVWRSLPLLKPEYQDIGPWLMRVARNCALDYCKSAGYARTEQIVTDYAASGQLEPEVFNGNRKILRQAFLTLSPEQKEVIVLSFYEGLSQAAIAERLGLPLGTVKGRVRLALARLRGSMERQAGIRQLC